MNSNKTKTAAATTAPLEIGGRVRVSPKAASVARRVHTEWCEESGIPEHLFTLNCLVSKERGIIENATGWATKGAQPVKGKVITVQRNKVGLDISQGYWYTPRFNWRKGTIDWKCAQYKPLAGAVNAKGKSIKYISSKGSDGAIYTLQVTPKEIHQAEAITGVEFPYWEHVNDETASALYWSWALKNPAVPVVVTEGIKKALALIGLGYPTIALPGVCNIWDSESDVRTLMRDLQVLRAPGKPAHLCFDSDVVEKWQVKKALKALGTELSQPLHGETESAAVRVWQWATNRAKGIDDLYAAEGEDAIALVADSAELLEDWLAGAADRSWQQVVLEDVVEGRFNYYFIKLKGEFHRYCDRTGSYAPCPTIEKLVSESLKKVDDPQGDAEKGKFTNASRIENIRAMVAYIGAERVVDPALVNPSSHWCTPEGVLVLRPEREGTGPYTITATVEPHQPYDGQKVCRIFTACTEWSYDLGATEKHLADFLSFCPKRHQDALLDTLSCTLDGETAHANIARMRGLFLTGVGANGKDTLRKVLTLMHPLRVTNIPLKTIRAHEGDANKFNLNAMTPQTAVNYSSENAGADLSFNETLKQLITADPIMSAKKGQDVQPVTVNAVQVHCTNRDLFLSNPQVSIVSRVAIIPLPYSFVDQRDYDKRTARGEAGIRLADVRFADRRWLAQNILPALFNQFVARFERVLNDRAIDWSSCDDALNTLVGASDHIKQFLMESSNIVVQEPGAQLDMSQLYKAYQQFCVLIDRAELVLDSSSQRALKDAQPDQACSKYDPLCKTQAVFNKRVAQVLGVEVTRKRVGKNRARVISGVSLLPENEWQV